MGEESKGGFRSHSVKGVKGRPYLREPPHRGDLEHAAGQMTVARPRPHGPSCRSLPSQTRAKMKKEQLGTRS